MIRSIALAALLAACVPPSMAHAQAGDPNQGRNLAANCANCHGTNGRSVAGMPALAGRPRIELVQLLKGFRDGERPATVMAQLAKGYTDAQIEAVCDFLSRQPASASR
jgi:sulfide dehydrogenase cytochrome subunit